MKSGSSWIGEDLAPRSAQIAGAFPGTDFAASSKADRTGIAEQVGYANGRWALVTWLVFRSSLLH